jgi:hypothetical protein
MQCMQILDQSGTMECQANEIDPSWYYVYLSYPSSYLASSNHLMAGKNKNPNFYALCSFPTHDIQDLCIPHKLIILPD